jgi:anti-sigma regulatory factor (Ser/Thr protein kinase)
MSRTRTFPCVPESVGAARRFATAGLSDTSPEVRDSVELMVSELATNCIRHTNAAFELSVVRDRAKIRVEVTDRGGGTPAMRSPGPDEPTGRGLRIVNTLSDSCGLEHRTGGNTVWFTVAASSTPRAQSRPARQARSL